MSKTKKTSVLGKFHDDAHSFIPLCCHYDEKTLLTKDGALVQTIQINGINQENISMNLLGLREIIRNSLMKNVNNTDLACWVHTIRRKVNLDDETPYPNLFSQNIHDIWVRKNYWNDKYVNTLFLSFVHKGYNFKLSDRETFIESFKANKTEAHHEAYLKSAREHLEQVVQGVASDLSEFGSERLGIVIDGEDAYCQISSVFYGLLRFIEKPIKIEEVDLSKIIGSFGYAVGSDKIEVITQTDRKYATILSLKEYQEVSAKSLDRMLQQPTEFAITEVFHFVDPKSAKSSIEHQNYILKVSGDENLAKQKGITTMLESEAKYKTPFCYQQISILIMNEDLEALDKSVDTLSFQLSRVGLVHVKEDINIENSFWSQVPGNFKYLRRLKFMSVETVASMASLHNFPAGKHTNPWGKAVTILRSERGTPFFFNFHNQSETGRALVIGNARSGKTIIANFLISEAMKYDPVVLFIAYADDSRVFINANYGKWAERPFNLNPFNIPSINNNPVLITQFLKNMATTGDETELSEDEKASLAKLTEFILNIPPENRSIDSISEFPFDGEAGASLKAKMVDYLPGGIFHDSFVDDGLWEEEVVGIQTISFEHLTNKEYEKEHYPKEDRALPEYKKKFNKFIIYREMLLVMNVLKFSDSFIDYKQVIKVENSNTLHTAKCDIDFYKEFFDRMVINNNVYVNSIQFSHDNPFFDSQMWTEMQTIFTTKIYLPAEEVPKSWKEKLQLNDKEFLKLKSIMPSSRLFIVKQDDLTITCETSIGGLPGIIKMMSADKDIIERCNAAMAEKGVDPENWLIEFYDSIR